VPVREVLCAARGRLPVPADAAHLPLHEAVRQAYERARTGRRGDSPAGGEPTVADIVAAVQPVPSPDATRGAPGP